MVDIEMRLILSEVPPLVSPSLETMEPFTQPMLATLVVRNLSLNLQRYRLQRGSVADMLIRDSKLFFKSTEQQHGFNFPYQLGCRGHPADTPQSAQTLQHSVKSGDVLVLATDGFFDNVFPEDVVSIVNSEVS
jgi:hypothetical protein